MRPSMFVLIYGGSACVTGFVLYELYKTVSMLAQAVGGAA